MTLLKLRESSPENGEINLELARMAAKMGDVPEAVRYYHNALYGVWPDRDSPLDQRLRDVRAELIELLIEDGEATSALSELLILSRDIPDTVGEHVRTGQLFLKNQDASRGLEHFSHALRLDRNSVDALIGAGLSEFELNKYSAAVRHLDAAFRLGAHSETAADALDVSKRVLADDPLAPDIGAESRVRRLLRGLKRADERLATCLAKGNSGSALVASRLNALQAEVASLKPQLTAAQTRRDPDLIRSGLGVLYRVEAAVESCGNADNSDRASMRIARMHGLEENDKSGR
jgi:tetratricopeptide (TPR) repeat protein